MKQTIKIVTIILLIEGLLLSCKKEYSCEDCAEKNDLPSGVQNHPPLANAGSDTSISLPANTAYLDGSRSTDPDSNISNYNWTKISGPSSFNISNANTVQTQVTDLVQGTYQFELKVADAGGLFSKDTLIVCVSETQRGKEFIYSGVWGCNDLCRDGDVYWTSDQTQCSPYSDPDLPLEVFLKLDSLPGWVEVRKYNSTLPSINQFYWKIDRNYLWVFAYEGRLIGTALTVKVKFL